MERGTRQREEEGKRRSRRDWILAVSVRGVPGKHHHAWSEIHNTEEQVQYQEVSGFPLQMQYQKGSDLFAC